MVKKDGIPQEIIEEIKLKELKEEIYKSKIIVEEHQVKLLIPSDLRAELDAKKGDTCTFRLTGKNKFMCEIKP